MAAAVRRGSSAELVRTWEGDRNLERRLKNRKNARGLCPRCLPAYNDKAAERMKQKRKRAS